MADLCRRKVLPKIWFKSSRVQSSPVKVKSSQAKQSKAKQSRAKQCNAKQSTPYIEGSQVKLLVLFKSTLLYSTLLYSTLLYSTLFSPTLPYQTHNLPYRLSSVSLYYLPYLDAFIPSNPFSLRLHQSAIDPLQLPTDYKPSCNILQRSLPLLPGPYCSIGLPNRPSLPSKYYEVFLVSSAIISPRHPPSALMNLGREPKWLRRSLYECFSVHLHRVG